MVSLSASEGGSHEQFDKLEKVGIDFDEISAQLLKEGVEKFEVAWNELLENVEKALDEAK